MSRLWRAAGRLASLLAHVVRGILILRWKFPRLDLPQRQVEVGAWSAGLLAALGLEVRLCGSWAALPNSVLLVANHVSWLDVAAIHSVLPQARFVAKAEVHHWPVIGWLCAAARTLFIERERKRDAMRVVHEMAAALKAGDTVAVFPEGTTNDGHALRAFHANLFQAALSTNSVILPVALRFSDPGHAISPAAEYAGDTTLWQSVRRILGAQGLCVTIAACDLISIEPSEDRRALAKRCQEVIERRLASL